MKEQDLILLDGAMGTMLQEAGLPVGHAPELWNLEHPDIVSAIGRRYIEAGSDILYTNTFGANRHKLGEADVATVVMAGVAAARRAVGDSGAKVALDVGPIGQLLEPLGSLPFDDAYAMYREVVVAGEAAGADLIVFETMSDLYEAKAAVLAAKENTHLPVWVTMTLEKSGRTFVGVTVPAMALTLSGLGVDALGFNCSLGPGELLPLVECLREWTDLPLILKPNAGLPDPESGHYHMTPSAFAADMARAVALGVSMIGGCCGTTPDFIVALHTMRSEQKPASRSPKTKNGLCSGMQAVPYGGIHVIGERINPTGKKRFAQALQEGDIAYILAQGVEQQEAGAAILDVNVGLPGIDEPTMMRKVVTQLQSVIDLPLQIDSSNIAALEAGLRYYNGKPIVNSVNGDPAVLDAVLPLCKKYGAAVIGLTMDSAGIPQTAEARIAIAERIIEHAEMAGIAREDVIIDCLTLTVSAQPEQAQETLAALHHVSRKMGMHTTLGVSNISFGLPAREHITAAFLTAALTAGLDMPIINPNHAAVMDALSAFRVLKGEDRNSEAYIARFSDRAARLSPVPDTPTGTLESAIARGLRDETVTLTTKALAEAEAMDVVNTQLIPALDRVGERYEQGKIFLPQLMQAAAAACAGFEVIRAHLIQTGKKGVDKGKIILATVQGDIHDIGKNIVKVVLENYGYTVLDLGRDVPPATIVETAVREKVALIGLSALMTTTVASMEKTIAALRESAHPCHIWVGGAVLTPAYAQKIGADFYARDAKQSVDIARKILG